MCDNDETSILPKLFNPGDAKTIQEAAKALREALKVGGEGGKYIADILGPFPRDLVGLLIGDPVSYARFRARAWYDKRVTKILKQRKIWGKTKPVSTSIALPLIEAAQDETREELREIWARLIANAMDPERSDAVRRNIIETVKQFEPLDAYILSLASRSDQAFSVDNIIAERRIISDTVDVSIQHLRKLGCLGGGHKSSTLGREILRACSLEEEEK